MAKQAKHTCKPEKWVDNYADEFLRFTILRVSSKDEAEDLVQETFFSALKSRANFRGDSSEKTWLYNILKNKIIDHYRKHKNKPVNSGNLSSEDDENDNFFERFFIESGAKEGAWNMNNAPGKYGDITTDPIEKEEFLSILNSCIERMPDLWQNIFKMKYFLELSGKEICKENEITSSNLWVIVHRSKLQLRGCLEKNWLRL